MNQIFKLFLFAILIAVPSFCIANEGDGANESSNDLHHDHRGASSSELIAPHWEALKADNVIVGSGDFSGKTYVLILHLGHSCLHCSQQLAHFNDAAARFQKLDADVVVVGKESTNQLASALGSREGDRDRSPGGIRFAVDPTEEIFRRFEAVDKQTDLPLHATFVIDATGRIRWSDIGEHPFMDSTTLLHEISLVRSGATTRQEDERADRPKIYLNKSPRIVAYQLKRLKNERLLLVERKTTDPKYAPVFNAILTRAGMSPQYREEALAALAKLNDTTAAAVLLTSLEKLPVKNRQQKQTVSELTKMLFEQPTEKLANQKAAFVESTEADGQLLRQVGFAGLMITGNADQAWTIAKDDADKTVDYLSSISLVDGQELRSGYTENIWASFANDEEAVRIESIKAMPLLGTGQERVFKELQPLVDNNDFRNAAVSTLLQVPNELRDPAASKKLVQSLLAYAESTAKADRTSDSFLDAMQLADQLLMRLPTAEAKEFRSKLSDVSVRVVTIGTLEEQMQYTVPYFAIEAGRPVQIVLDNHDLMAHNLVICQPGKLKQVAADGLAAGPKNGLDGKPYVPKTKDVLAATEMIQAYQRGPLTFDAPTTPGNYPYVCTFPQHWPRMYGVMVVVEDLDAWLQNPVAPEDPLGSKRQFVKKWTVDELAAGLATNTAPRSLEKGKTLFTEATCAACHVLGGSGGAVGPALDEVVSRWKGDRQALIREIVEPSHRIDEKYSMHVILTLDGDTITGIIQSENDDEIELLDNPESKETVKIAKDDIDEMVKTSKSIMPKGLLDNFAQEEIYELLHYIEASQKK